MASRVFACEGVLLLALIAATALVAEVSAVPWNLPDYDRVCHHSRLGGIRGEASGVTYSPVTNSFWVVTRNPMSLFEYDLDGERLRTVPAGNLRFRDPEGITWMYEYRFAISQERSQNDRPGRRKSQITIVDIPPWERRGKIVKRIDMDFFRQASNKGLESITWDPDAQELITGQEMKPVRAFRVDPDTGRSRTVFPEAERGSLLRDFAGMYYRPGDEGIYVLSRGGDRVLKLDKDGELVDGQITHLPSRSPEGLTFTDDGALLISVGEPNEVVIKSSIGTCDYKPGDGVSSKYISIRRDTNSDVSSEQEEEAGEPYCSWDKCEGEAGQGTAFCRASTANCVGVCGGWWCRPGRSAITPDNFEAPEPPSPPSPPPTPPAPGWYEDPEKGYCNWDDCNGGAQGMEWCRAGVANCVACMGTWCPHSRVPEPIDQKLYRALVPEEEAEPERGSKHVRVEPTEAPLVGPTAFEAAAAALSAPAAEQSEEAEQEEDEDLQRGYMALMSMLVAGVDGGLGKREEDWVSELVAELSFGSPAASSLVTVEQPRKLLGRRLSSDETDANMSAELCNGRPASVIRVQLLGDTPAHADYLSRLLEAAITSGDVAAKLGARGVGSVESVRVLGAGVKQAPISPQHFPMLDTLDQDPNEIEVVVVTYPEQRRALSVGLLAGLVAVFIVVLLCVAAVLWVVYRRPTRVAVCTPKQQPTDKLDAEDTVLEMPAPHKAIKPSCSSGDGSVSGGLAVAE